MKKFMDEEFLLDTDCAKSLYHDFAEKTPILDYHCHINPKEIYEDRKFDNIFKLWLGGDHYKWRQMRINAVPEEYITGDKPEFEKFKKWAETLSSLIGNPLYHWSHMELKKYFGFEGYLNGDNAEEVWNLCNEKLKEDSMSVRNIIKKSNVRLICTTDDPIDDLKWHKLIREDETFDVEVLPAWRPDKVLNIEKNEFSSYISKLSKTVDFEINTIFDLKKALIERLDYFVENKARISDHGLTYLMFRNCSEDEANRILNKALKHEKLEDESVLKYRTYVLSFLAGEYKKRNMVMQIHYGCIRDNNSDMYNKLSVDTGFDAVNNYAPAGEIAKFLDYISINGNLPKTILYSLNENDNSVINTITGCFAKAPYKNMVTQGSAWWFNDHKEGMINQLKSYANLSCLGNFIGMLTDSRSFLSYTRHDYFRRILCNLIGGWVENGEYPYDRKSLEKIIKGISYNNAVKYFEFDLEEYR